MPIKIDKEYRVIVSNDKFITASAYRVNGKLNYINSDNNENLKEFVEKVTKVNYPEIHPVFVLDVAETQEGLKVLEVGSVNCAGFYSCDLKQIVKVISNEAEKEYND